ncbi:MAG: PP2C family protein-serine/threonine phosphatase [Oscillospiraceae bacterium]
MREWLVYGESGALQGVTLPLWAAAAALLAVAALLLLLAVWGVRKARLHSGGKRAAELPRVDRVSVGKLHEQGAREGQQDCFAVSDEALMSTHGLLAVVADGMGGLSDGDKVSAAAVQAVLDEFILCRDAAGPEQLLLTLAQSAAQAVNELLGPEGCRRSGSTLAMGLVREGSFSFLSIGDSRICLYRGGVLTQLNREHTYQNDLALRAVNGELSVQEALSDPQGNGLTSFLGMGKLAGIDLPAAPIRLLSGDKLILMSDGVYNALSGEELARALEAGPEEAAQAIRAAVQEKNYSNQDNYTAVILECAADGARSAGQLQ